MLLNEILYKDIPSLRQSTKPISDILDNKNYEVVGTGAQAIAYLHKKFPGKIIKTIQIHGPHDPSYQFLRLILKHQDNPYFPKIFSVKLYKTIKTTYEERGALFDMLGSEVDFSIPPSDLNSTLFVVTERLTRLGEITKQDIERFGLGQTDIDMIQYKYPNAKRIPERALTAAFRLPKTRKEMLQKITDPNLNKALRLLEPLFRNYEPDMHGSNIMLRGSQWVIADPISHPQDPIFNNMDDD